MEKLTDLLNKDIRFIEGLKACMNCGVCTAICPAAEFYRYDPRVICETVQRGNEQEIEALLKSETIWYCGECMSCKTRCPRGNTPGFVVMALRKLSQQMGYFTQSEKGRQQFAIKRAIGHSILSTGYCVRPELVAPENHPEQGPVWEWVYDHLPEVMERTGGNYKMRGPGALREIDEETMQELNQIFQVTGGSNMFETIENYSLRKAHEMKLEASNNGIDNEYFAHTYNQNNGQHNH